MTILGSLCTVVADVCNDTDDGALCDFEIDSHGYDNQSLFTLILKTKGHLFIKCPLY